MRIFVADDHAVVRRGVIQLVREAFPDVEIGEASSVHDLFRTLRTDRIWDVLVLDISMPGAIGLETLKDFRREFPTIPVLVLSAHPEERYGVRALKAGAAGYLTKESAPEDLPKAVRKILVGGRYITSTLAETLADTLGTLADSPLHERLSDREYEVLRGIGGGKSVSQLAREMCLSEKTVSTYRTRLLQKMQMETTADLMHYAIRNDLLD
jgi:DNA-binding NarL/FixJ family response regulator